MYIAFQTNLFVLAIYGGWNVSGVQKYLETLNTWTMQQKYVTCFAVAHSQ